MASRRKQPTSPIEGVIWIIASIVAVVVFFLFLGAFCKFGIPLMILGAVSKFGGGGKKH